MTPEEKEIARVYNSPKGRAKTTSVIQLEAVECGAASLKMVMGYYGRHVALEALREDCGVNRDGSKAINILKAARKNDMEASGYKVEDLKEFLDFDFPLIIHWNFNHFIVLEGFKNGKFYVNDPAMGHRTLSFEEFNNCFTGIALYCKPNENFVADGRQSTLIASLRERLDGYRTSILYLFVVGLFLVIPGLVIPVFSRIFVDDILISKSTDWLWPLIAGMALTGVLRGVLQWLRLTVLMKAENKLEMVSSAKYFWHLLKLPIQFFHQRDAGEMGSRLALNHKIANLITSQLASNLLDLFVVVFYFLLMLQYDVTLSV